MDQNSLTIINSVMQHLFQKLKGELKTLQLIKILPLYNQGYVSKISNACTSTQYMVHPGIRYVHLDDKLEEDRVPKTSPIDQHATFFLQTFNEIKGPIFIEKEALVESQHSSRQKKTSSHHRSSSLTRRSLLGQRKKIIAGPENINSSLIQLPIQQVTNAEKELQTELRSIQKRIYYGRKMKKQQQDKQRQIIEALRRRKSPQIPTTDFTYEFDGSFLKRSDGEKEKICANELKVSHSTDFRNKDKIQGVNDADQNSNRGRSQLNSRYEKSILFNNSNKRQVSHLPFIKMIQNSKLKQANKNMQGSRTQRLTLKSFNQSLQQKSFKHYSQIQKQRRDRELIDRLEAQRLDNLDKNLNRNPEMTQQQGFTNNLARRRQSFLLNKYLKKLKQQSIDEPKRSLNFNRVNFPKNTPIHNYYKYDFNEERRVYESSVISRVLDNIQSTR